MATVSLDFPEFFEEKTTKPTRIEKKSSPDNRIKLYCFEGNYEIWVDGLLMCCPSTEEIAVRSFERLLNPVEEIKEIPKIDIQLEDTSVTSTHKCPNCGVEVNDERTTLVGVLTCPECTPQPAKLYGVLDYGHKTGGTLMMTENVKLFKLLKKPINQQR